MKPENISPELKEKLTNAKSLDEIKALAAEAGLALSDEALSEIAGGLEKSHCLKDSFCPDKAPIFQPIV